MIRNHGLGRRAALLAAMGGLAGTPAARGQTIPPVPPLPQVPPPRPPAPLATSAIDKTKIYYVFFNHVIDAASMGGLRRQLATLIEAGVTQIVLVINSGGGDTLQSLTTYSFIRSLPAQVDTHAQGFVASAATVLFLAGQDRSSDRTARFLFHPTQTTITGFVNEQQIHERMVVVDSVEDQMRQIYMDRTRLTEQQVNQFGRSEVIYTADQALQLGVVQTVSDLKLPGGQTARIILLD